MTSGFLTIPKLTRERMEEKMTKDDLIFRSIIQQEVIDNATKEFDKLKEENKRLISIIDECRDWVDIHRNETTGMVDNYELRQIEARLDGYIEGEDVGFVPKQ